MPLGKGNKSMLVHDKRKCMVLIVVFKQVQHVWDLSLKNVGKFEPT